MIVLYVLILAFSIIIHEVSHGVVAYKYGDDTAYLMGRLTLNPLPHIDPVGTILVPMACYFLHLPVFGWAKPVPVNSLRLEHPRADMGKVALAGPASNIMLSIVFLLLYKIVIITSSSVSSDIMWLFSSAIMLNLFLAIFNLIPIPPMDGSKILYSVLPYDAADKYMRLERYGMAFVIAFLFLGGAQYIVQPIVMFIMQGFNIIL